MSFELIVHYFPDLSPKQVKQFERLGALYRVWNERINVISRKDIDNLYERHILYSLGIARVMRFKPGTKILDAGTGGGFPGIPLAIMFPDAHFHLIDSTSKKLTVVNDIAAVVGLQNITTEHVRLEAHRGRYDFIVSRAVSSIPEFLTMVSHLLPAERKNSPDQGILYLKGGEVDNELKMAKRKYKVSELSQFFKEEFFSTKKLIHIY